MIDLTLIAFRARARARRTARTKRCTEVFGSSFLTCARVNSSAQRIANDLAWSKNTVLVLSETVLVIVIEMGHQ